MFDPVIRPHGMGLLSDENFHLEGFPGFDLFRGPDDRHVELFQNGFVVHVFPPVDAFEKLLVYLNGEVFLGQSDPPAPRDRQSACQGRLEHLSSSHGSPRLIQWFQAESACETPFLLCVT